MRTRNQIQQVPLKNLLFIKTKSPADFLFEDE